MTLSIFSNQNTAHLIELFIWMLGAFLIGWFFWRWWYMNKSKQESYDLVEEEDDLYQSDDHTLKVRKVTAPGVKDIAEDTPIASSFVDGVAKLDDRVKDDLTKVEGIGPKIAGLLNNQGIWSYQQLSECSIDTLQELLINAGPRYRIHNPGTWPDQAKMAAEGNWEALENWQDQLKGGR